MVLPANSIHANSLVVRINFDLKNVVQEIGFGISGFRERSSNSGKELYHSPVYYALDFQFYELNEVQLDGSSCLGRSILHALWLRGNGEACIVRVGASRHTTGPYHFHKDVPHPVSTYWPKYSRFNTKSDVHTGSLGESVLQI